MRPPARCAGAASCTAPRTRCAPFRHDIIAAFEAEELFNRACAEKQRAVPEAKPGNEVARAAYRDTVFTPFARDQLAQLCVQLYELRVPPHLVERFRRAMQEYF